MNTTREFLFYQDRELVFGAQKTKISDFLKDYQGPFFLYDLKMVRSRYRELSRELAGVEVYYAMKANSHPAILRALASEGAGADVVSAGEIKRALSCGFLPEKIVYSGVGKTEKELRYAIEVGIHQINVESIPELQRIVRLAASFQKRVNIALRLNPDVSIKTHPYIATGLRENKFGIELEQLPEATAELAGQNFVGLVGVSLHLGSQMMSFESFDHALSRLLPIFEDLQKKFSTCQVFDIGGGLGVFYEQQNLEKESQLLKDYAEVVKKHFSQRRIILQTEPGRWLVAHAGVLVTQVQYVKKTPYRQFIIVDSGMNHLLRPALYQAVHQVHALKQSESTMRADVVGPICESADFFAKNCQIYQVSQGDYLVIQDVGAYGASMSSTYNLQDLAEEKYFE